MKDFAVNVSDTPLSQGDIIKVDGKTYKIAKRTTTAVQVTRYFWFDRLWDKYVGGK